MSTNVDDENVSGEEEEEVIISSELIRRPSRMDLSLTRLPLRRTPILPIIRQSPDLTNPFNDRSYVRPIVHFLGATGNREGPGLFYVREAILNPWLNEFPRCEMLARHRVYKPTESDWGEVHPKTAFRRLTDFMIPNSVTTMVIFRNYMLVGLGNGQVVLYDLVPNQVLKTYRAHQHQVIRQIIVGKKENRFFVVTLTDLVEFSYFELTEKFRFSSTTNIRTVLYEQNPMLVLNEAGYFYEFSPVACVEERVAVMPTGFSVEDISKIIELKSYDLSTRELTRPCILRNRCCIAIADLANISSHKIEVWRKELLTSNPEDEILMECYQSKLFYAVVDSIFVNANTKIHVISLTDIGLPTSIESITLQGGILYSMSVKESYLITQSRTKQIEIYDATTHVKRYHVSIDFLCPLVTIINNCLVLGTEQACMVTKALPSSNEYCLRCIPYFKSVDNQLVRKLCQHFIPDLSCLKS
jgi:hypothetical protein